MKPDGYYQATITEGYCEEDGYEAGAVVICLDVDVEGEPYTCRHSTQGKMGWSGEALIRHLELPWPTGISQLDLAVGKSVQVKLKTNDKGKQTAFVVTGRKRADADTIARAVQKLGVDDENIPF